MFTMGWSFVVVVVVVVGGCGICNNAVVVVVVIVVVCGGGVCNDAVAVVDLCDNGKEDGRRNEYFVDFLFIFN